MEISLSGTPALIAIVITLGIPIWITFMVISRLSRKAHEAQIKWDNIVKTEYEAPLNLTPAELGYLTDSKFDKKELIGTILDLEQRGYLDIVKDGLGYDLVKIMVPTKDLKAHEEFVQNNFANTNNLANYMQGRFNVNLGSFKKLVRQDLYKKGLVKKNYINASLSVRRILFVYLFLSLLVSFGFFLWAIYSSIVYPETDTGSPFLFLFFTPVLFFPIIMPISVVGGLIYNGVVGEMPIWTKKMKSAWADVEGYKEYVRQVELDNIQFESKELKQKSKIKALPYAVAMGFNTDWQKRF